MNVHSAVNLHCLLRRRIDSLSLSSSCFFPAAVAQHRSRSPQSRQNRIGTFFVNTKNIQAPASRHPVRRLALAAAVATLTLAACGEQAPSAPPAPPPPEVLTVTIQPRAVTLHTELAGRTSPYLVAEVRPQVSGIVRERKFTEGTDVKAGQVLYQVDDAVYNAAVESARAALAKAEANLKSAQVTAGRYEKLSQVDAVSQQARDDARAALALANADVAAAKAALESARIDLEHSRITAPIDGRIGRSSVTAGALVTAGQAQSLATIQQLDPIYVDLTRSANELMKLRRDLESGKLRSVGKDQARVKLMLPDGSEYEHEGRLQFSEVTVDPGTGSVTLRAVFPNPDRHLLPGMYVRALLEEGVRDNAILAPQRGVTRDARGQAVALVVDAEGKVAQRQVATERAIGDQWLVSDGLAAGDRLIVEGLQKIRPGIPVTVVEAEGAAGNAPAGNESQAGPATQGGTAPQGEAAAPAAAD